MKERKTELKTNERNKDITEMEVQQKVKKKVMSLLNEGTLKVMPLTMSAFDT